ncbi:MAG: PIG-L deacetylase family protein [Anaerolineae bacterium]
MQRQHRLLAVFAHPDDESFGPGGTLARYAAEGADVHVLIMTDGAVGSVDPEAVDDETDLAAVRTRELHQAMDVLQATLYQFQYRDSGMAGSETNLHPDSLVQADQDEVTGRVVRLIREIQPQVVMTHDPAGGYFHPDHIAVNKIVTRAFQLAGDASAYRDQIEQGLTAYQPQKLYYTALPRTFIKWAVRLLRLLRKDPTRFGRNGDIDLTRLGTPDELIHTWIDVSDYLDTKMLAGAAHRSQGGGPGFQRYFPGFIVRRMFGREMFIRAHPTPAPNTPVERDLFAGIDSDVVLLPEREL